MTSSNDITGARLISRENTKEYDEGYDRIFGKKNLDNDCMDCRCVIHDNDEEEIVND